MAEAVRDIAPVWSPRVRYSTIKSNSFGDEDYRLDAGTYTQVAFEALQVLKLHPLGTVPFGSLTGQIYHPTESQPRSNFKRIWVSEKDGVPFLTGRQLTFFRPIAKKYISQKMPKLTELLLPQGTILLSRSGSTGHPVIVGERLTHFAITDDALRIFKGSGPVGFVYAFLSSFFVQALIAKAEYGKVVVHIEAKHIASIPVPKFSDALKKCIHEKISRAFSMRDAANKLLDRADIELHQSLGVAPFVESDVEYLGPSQRGRAFSISSVGMLNRLDATNHVPTARSAVHKLSRGRFKLIPLGELVGRKNIYVAPRFARIYVEELYGTPLLQGSQLPLMRPYDLKYISTTKTERLDRWIIKAGWVLVTCSGTIGRVGLSTRKQEGWAASQHILRVMPLKSVVHPGFLAAFLTTPFGQHQMTAKIYGGVVDELTSDDMAAVMVPNVPFVEQEKIGASVLEAYEMRDSANDLELSAISELESEIGGGGNGDDRDDIVTARRRIAEITDASDRPVQGMNFTDL